MRKLIVALIVALHTAAFADTPLFEGASLRVQSSSRIPNTAELSWTASPSPDVTGYRVYFGTAPRTYQQPKGSGIDVGLKLQAFLADFTVGQRVYFAVTAYNAAGEESEYSGEASKVMSP